MCVLCPSCGTKTKAVALCEQCGKVICLRCGIFKNIKFVCQGCQ